jgi:signal transduction histidine kinase
VYHPTAVSLRSIVVGLLCAIGALGIGFGSWAETVPTAAAEARKHILVVYDEDQAAFPGLALLDRRLRDVFASGLGNRIDLYTESLGLSRFEWAGHDRVMADHYRRKYASKKLDLIIAVMGPSLDFLLAHGEALFPGVPIVFCGVDASRLEGKTLRPNVTGVLVKRAFAPTLEIALRLQPDTHNIFVIGGASRFDRQLQTLVRRDLQPFDGRVTITYLVGLPMDSLLQSVASLPPRSVILYTTLFTDGRGVGFVPHEALSSIAGAATVPVYVFLDQFVGRGAVGGNVYSLDAQGSQVAQLALEILRGAAPANLPVRELGAQVDMFDARALRRWGLDEHRLPPGSVVRHREPSIWALYRWYIVGAIAVVVSQSALITGLLLARVRRRRAEAEARRQQEELAHVLRVTTLNELTTSLAHEISQPLGAILSNAQAARRLLAGEPADVKEVGEALTDIAADARRASLIIGRLRTLFRKAHVEPVAVDLNAVIEDVVKLLHSDMLGRRIDVRLALGEAPPVLGDPVQLEQVMLNVVVNASEAIGAAEGRREITIRTGQGQSGRLVVEVVDTGVGVKEGELERIFEHFVSTKPQGLGMGLAISRSIIKAHGGRIWATANPDRGLTVHVELPGRNQPARSAAAARPRPSVDEVQAAAAAGVGGDRT